MVLYLLTIALRKETQSIISFLRDDINFAAITDEKAVDTGERVGADDVVFSFNRAKDQTLYQITAHIACMNILKM